MSIFKWVRWKAPKPNAWPKCNKRDMIIWMNGEWVGERCDHIC
jgi:hypothetical protein